MMVMAGEPRRTRLVRRIHYGGKALEGRVGPGLAGSAPGDKVILPLHSMKNQ
jgi:hypothetical protein